MAEQRWKAYSKDLCWLPVEDEYANKAEGKWKTKRGSLAAAFLHVPFYLALVKNTESLSIMNASQSKEADMRGNQSPFTPCEPLSGFGAYCISHKLFSEHALSLSDR